jgi:hypothetical protein
MHPRLIKISFQNPKTKNLKLNPPKAPHSSTKHNQSLPHPKTQNSLYAEIHFNKLPKNKTHEQINEHKKINPKRTNKHGGIKPSSSKPKRKEKIHENPVQSSNREVLILLMFYFCL